MRTRSTARSRPRSASSRRWSTCEFPPRPRRPARRATANPRRRRNLNANQIDGPIPKQIGLLTKLKRLRVPPASPTPGAPREPPLGVAGTSKATRSSARSRPSSASSRSWTTCEFSPRPRCPARRATDPRRRRHLKSNKISGTFPLALCDVESCLVSSVGTNLMAPCGSMDCCDLGNGVACPTPSPEPRPEPRPEPTPVPAPAHTPKPTTEPTKPTTPETTTEPTPEPGPCNQVEIFGRCISKTTTQLRVPPASPTPGAARDRPSASQDPRPQRDHRPDPDRDRLAQGAAVPASSPRVPDARRGARPFLGVAGTSTATRSPARSRPRSASSRR